MFEFIVDKIREFRINIDFAKYDDLCREEYYHQVESEYGQKVFTRTIKSVIANIHETAYGKYEAQMRDCKSKVRAAQALYDTTLANLKHFTIADKAAIDAEPQSNASCSADSGDPMKEQRVTVKRLQAELEKSKTELEAAEDHFALLESQKEEFLTQTVRDIGRDRVTQMAEHLLKRKNRFLEKFDREDEVQERRIKHRQLWLAAKGISLK